MNSEFHQKLLGLNKVLIISSTPIDYDCLGTALALKSWLIKNGTPEVQTYTFVKIPEHIKNFPGISDVKEKYINEVDFNYYDKIILVDGNSWKQFLTFKFRTVLEKVSKEKFINIDHHLSGELEKDLTENCLRIDECCTGKVLYDYFYKPTSVEPDLESATWLYYSLVGDTGVFQFNVSSLVFDFASVLLSKGVNHEKTTTFTVSKKMIDFTQWAIQNTQYFPNEFLTVLIIDKQKEQLLAQTYGTDWYEQDLDRNYKSTFMRTVEGFPHAINLIYLPKLQKYKISWRSSNFYSKYNLFDILTSAGFSVGGHTNAGGGETDIEPPLSLEKILNEIKKVLSSN